MSEVAFFWCCVAIVAVIIGFVVSSFGDKQRASASTLADLAGADRKEGCGCVMMIVAAACIVAALVLLVILKAHP